MPCKISRAFIALLLAVLMLSFASACKKSDDEADDENDNSTATETAGVKYAPNGNEGTLTGTISFSGAAPEQKAISMDQDPACAQNNPNPRTEDVVVKDGKLENVFVYLKDGKTADGKNLATLAFDAPATEVVLDQKGCHYVPHVLGVMAGQKVKITNSDPTTHNVHPTPKNNEAWNQSQPPNSPAIEKAFARAEVLVPVKCNQHPWMKAWIGVLKNPLYAVTGEGGKFQITGVPPGTYTLVAYHEKYGEKSQPVTVGAKESKTLDFTFDASSAATASAAKGSLEVLPALDVPMLMKH